MQRRFTTLALLSLLWLPRGLGAAEKQVAVVKPVLSQFEDGPPIPASYEFLPGETVFLSFQIGNYQATEKDQIRLSYRIEAVDPGGVSLVAPQGGKVEAELTRQDKEKEWMPKVRYSILVPPAPELGAQRIIMSVKDELNGTSAQNEVVFRVRGRQVEPSDTLTVRNFRFLRSEEAAEPQAVAAYRPGDALWARFDITGYRFGDKNRFRVDYGLSVLRAGDKEMFTEPEAAVIEQESFYPQRYVPGVLNLNLTPDLARGEYTIVLSVRDRTGGQTHESRHVFQVE